LQLKQSLAIRIFRAKTFLQSIKEQIRFSSKKTVIGEKQKVFFVLNNSQLLLLIHNNASMPEN